MQLAVGAAVTIVGLQRRADLNGCQGHVLAGVKAERIPVRVSSPTGTEDVLIKLQNLQVRAADSVLSDVDLLLLILECIPRWEQAEQLSRVSRLWRRTILESRQFWRSLVVVPACEAKPSATALNHVLSRRPGHADRTIVRHVHGGALPVHATELRRVPDLAWVETLIVPGAAELVDDGEPDCIDTYVTALTGEATQYYRYLDRFAQAAEVALICAHHFPCLRTLSFNLNKHGKRDPLLQYGQRVQGAPFPMPVPVIENAALRALKPWMAALPASLQCLDLPFLEEIQTGSWRTADKWTLWDDLPLERLTSLKALNPLVVWKGPRMNPGSTTGEVPIALRDFPDALCASLEAADGLTNIRHDDPPLILQRLPRLRRVLFNWCGGPSHAALMELCAALLQHGHVESLFLHVSECEWGGVLSVNRVDSPWRAFAGLKDQLKELVLVGDECDFTNGPTASKVKQLLRQLLPRTAVVIARLGSLSFDEDGADAEALPQPLARLILPHLLESWQMHPTAKGAPIHNSTDCTVRAQLEADRRRYMREYHNLSR
tara:strand:+ start:201 stop:1841 length:1641 start_codon:yes stop_codon:yes gene_type:complete